MGYRIYILLLERNNYYVGRTKNSRGRLRQHFTGKGAKWTQKHKPIKVVEFFFGEDIDEKIKTLEYMRRYGWRKVRGHSWTTPKLTRIPKPIIEDLVQCH